MTRRLLPLAALPLVALAALGPLAGNAAGRGNAPSGPPDEFIADWDLVTTQSLTAAAASPADYFPVYAYVGIAIYDAVMAVRGGYEPFMVDAPAPAGASAEAAASRAARDVLLHYLPGQAAIIDAAYADALAAVPDGQAEDDGLAVGAAVAAAVIAERANDGYKAPATYVPPDPPIPGVWIPTAPVPAIGVWSGDMTPFALRSPDQFRPAGPPALNSKKWARDYNEVKEIGSATSTTRTPEQTVAARFWGEPPLHQSHAALRMFVLERDLDIVDAARFMAMVTVVQADAFSACFDAKYHYAFWRPITAIRAGDTDGNDATVGDPGWMTLLPGTPNHPEYPSAHSCVTPATAEVVSRFLRTEHIGLTIPSLTGLGDRYYPTAKSLTAEVGEARIWGGIHFRTAVEDGTKIASKTARHVLARHFKQSR
jgi:hypothetical protein